VLEAEGGEEALDAMHLAKARVDLVIIDVVMPGMDGVELAQQVREQWPEKRILFTSGHAAEVLAQHGLAELDVPFLAKPYTRDEILTKVHEALDHRPGTNAEAPAERRRRPRLRGK
jgi:YesN/AraC family two-component response regulator